MVQTPDIKLADTSDRVHELIRRRWSPRSFRAVNIPDADLQVMLEAGRWAASSGNEQPWRFLVARHADPAFAKMVSILNRNNQLWAKNASFLILTVAKKTSGRDSKPNALAVHDTGAAMANIFLEATALGYQAHGMGGYDKDAAVRELHIPDDYEPVAFMAIGVPGDPEELAMDESYRALEKAKRTRKQLSEITFSGEWDQPLRFEGGA